MVSICCSPPERNPPWRPSSSRSFGKRSKTALDRPVPGRSGAARGHVEVLPDREIGEDAPVLRDEADAGAGDAVGRPAGDVGPFHITRPRCGGVRPMMLRMVVVLPTPLRPSRHTHSPRGPRATRRRARATARRRCRCRPRRAAAVVPSALSQVDAPHLGVARAPRPGVPSAITRPWWSTVIRWAMENTTSMSCSVKSSVSPRSRAMRSTSRMVSRVSVPTCRRSARRAAASRARGPARSPARAASGRRGEEAARLARLSEQAERVQQRLGLLAVEPLDAGPEVRSRARGGTGRRPGCSRTP